MTADPPLSDRYPPGVSTVLIALAAGLAGLLGSFGAAGYTPTFVVSPVERTLSRRMPGAVVTFAITTLGDLGHQLNLATAGALVVGLFALVVGGSIGLGRRLDSRLLPVVGAPLGAWVVTVLLTGAAIPALGAALGTGAVVLLTDLSRSGERAIGRVDPTGRRRVVSALGVAAGTGAVGVSLGRQRTAPTVDGVNQHIYGDVDPPVFDVEPELELAADRSVAVGEMEPLVSEDFYTVDISSIDPSPNAADWSLSVTGAVETPFELDYADLREMDVEHRFVTLRCVGEGLNGTKMDTALWSGVPVASILERAQPTSDCNCVMLRATDKYYEEFPLDALRPGMLALGMNGGPLPRAHGAPVRALVPGHWGEVNVKWLTEIELLKREQTGYWEKRGWQGTGPVNTVAKLHGTERVESGDVVVGGHVYAGTRGIQQVEVSTDGGDSWQEASLTERLPGAWGPAVSDSPDAATDAWRQWQYRYDPPGGAHEVVVRAVDGTGTRQPREENGPYPSGPTGWVSQTIEPGSL